MPRIERHVLNLDQPQAMTRTTREQLRWQKPVYGAMIFAVPHYESSVSGPPQRRRRWPTSFQAQVSSISRPVWERLTGGPATLQTLARFQRAINLVVSDAYLDGAHKAEQIIALVTPDLGNGPFHLVVDRLLPDLPAPAETRWIGDDLEAGPWSLHIGAACRIWEPRPRWEKLNIEDDRYRHLCAWAQDVAAQHDPTPSIAQLIATLETRIQELCRALRARDHQRVHTAAAALAGLGPGLTPSGDDALAGAMLALWAAHHPERKQWSRTMTAAAAPRTTRLSRAFLHAAEAGLADEKWHDLLNALSKHTPADQNPDALEQAARRILDFGATSGPDMLRGFIQGYQAVRRVS